IAVNQLLNLQLFVGIVFVENRYLYLLASTILPVVFLSYPARAGGTAGAVSYLDIALAALAVIVGCYFAWNAQRILNEAWEYGAPAVAIALSGVFVLLIIEALRRTAGWVITVIVFAFAMYPVVADKMPGPIEGLPQTLPDTIA